MIGAEHSQLNIHSVLDSQQVRAIRLRDMRSYGIQIGVQLADSLAGIVREHKQCVLHTPPSIAASNVCAAMVGVHPGA